MKLNDNFEIQKKKNRLELEKQVFCNEFCDAIYARWQQILDLICPEKELLKKKEILESIQSPSPLLPSLLNGKLVENLHIENFKSSKFTKF